MADKPGGTDLGPALADAKGLDQNEENQSSPDSDLADTLASEQTPALPPTEADLVELAKPNPFDSSLEAEAVGGRGSEEGYPEAGELEENTGLTGDAHISSEPGHDPSTPQRDTDLQAPDSPQVERDSSADKQ